MSLGYREFAAALLIAGCMCIPGAGAQSTKEQIRPLVLALSGDANLGDNASTTLYLQLWSTMRRAHKGKPFSPSITRWSDSAAEPGTHQEVISRAKEGTSHHVVLWGRSFRYGGGVLVEPRITVPANSGRRFANEKWSVVFRDKRYVVQFPNRQIDWASTVLTNGDLVAYGHPFVGVPIYRSRASQEIRGYMTGWVEALEWGPGYGKVSDRGDDGRRFVGWLRIPQIGGKDRASVVYAAAGIVRMMRGDYEGAISLFNRVLKSPEEATTRNLLDVRMLRGAARELSGKSGLKDFEYVYSQDPFSNASIEHYAGGILSRNNQQSAETKLQRVKALLGQSGFYLDKQSDFRGF